MTTSLIASDTILLLTYPYFHVYLDTTHPPYHHIKTIQSLPQHSYVLLISFNLRWPILISSCFFSTIAQSFRANYVINKPVFITKSLHCRVCEWALTAQPNPILHNVTCNNNWWHNWPSLSRFSVYISWW